MIGRRLSHYRIVDLLGQGGMGVVYRAHDEHLERDVAVKVLPAGSLASDEARRRFRSEALALSHLQHANVGVIHDFDSQDGVDYLVMELVPGEGLDERIRRGKVSEPEIARLGEQLAEGLAAAHASGVLHRDVKPQNLRVTPTGQLKVLDFGLARALPGGGTQAGTMTAPGLGNIVGTLPYMSPEQLRGDTLDERSDLYAVGAVLYELAAGRVAFSRSSPEATMLAVLHQAPPPLPAERSSAGSELERIIFKCLEKSPDDRYQSARELAVDLRRFAHHSAGPLIPVRRPASRRARSRTLAMAIAAAAVVLILAAIVLDAGGLRSRIFGQAGAGTKLSLAVLPLANRSGDPGQDGFTDGMTDELINRLSQVAALRVISRTSVMRFKGTQRSLRDIGRELGVGMIVEGSVLRAGDLVRISAQLIEVRNDRNVWAQSYERELRDVLRLQSDVAGAVVENVRVRLTAGERTRMATARRVDPKAFEAYLRGVAAFNRQSTEGYTAAVAEYEEAIAGDSTYAPAYVGLAQALEFSSGIYMPSSEALPRARVALGRALELDAENAAAHATVGYLKMMHDWDWGGAEQSFRHALAVNPNEGMAHQNYGACLTVLGRFDEAVRELEWAREMDPLSPLSATMSVWPLFEGQRWDQAIAKGTAVTESFPNHYMPRMLLGQALFFAGERERGIESLRASTRLDPGNPFPLGWLAYAHAVSGSRAPALAILDTLERMPPARYVQPYTFALVHVGLGNRARALELLEEGVKGRTDEVVMIGVDPAMDPLRSEPRFQMLLRTMGLPANR